MSDPTIFGSKELFSNYFSGSLAGASVNGVNPKQLADRAWNICKFAAGSENILMADTPGEKDGKVYKSTVSANTLGRASAYMLAATENIIAGSDPALQQQKKLYAKISEGFSSLISNISDDRSFNAANTAQDKIHNTLRKGLPADIKEQITSLVEPQEATAPKLSGPAPGPAQKLGL